ncbi:hypothetical protein [Streptomyces sp. MI02-7b]|uniref:hypothetical protein n=1 Tax=Streptomyces sp. MI02-7b TaxID=462941 RepID=UPI0029AB7A54|nr:hypothetical protein [Streptomyces sp. MI02-7b]MDX3073246.1 hypothetical protein [Streptomyces sp. MI02-7b]
MAARKTTSRPSTTEPPKCPDCQDGEITETVRVGSRKGRETGDRQAALCLTCFGTGTAPS